MTTSHNSSDKVSRHSSVHRARSLSESIKGLFKSSSSSSSSSVNNHHTHKNNTAATRANPVSPKVVIQQQPTVAELPAFAEIPEGSKSHTNGSQKVPLHINTSSIYEAISPVHSPVMSNARQKPKGSQQYLPNIAKLSLSPPSMKRDDKFSHESSDISDEDPLHVDKKYLNKKEFSSSGKDAMYAPIPVPGPSTADRSDNNLIDETNLSSIDAMLEVSNKNTVPNATSKSATVPPPVLHKHRNSTGHSFNTNVKNSSLRQENLNVNSRSRSLRRGNSLSSSTSSVSNSASIGSLSTTNKSPYSNGRKHAESVSASNLMKYMEHESKCILNVENFKVFENGYHQHNLRKMAIVSNEEKKKSKLSPAVSNTVNFSSSLNVDDRIDSNALVNDDDTDTISLQKQKSGFSLSGLFKPHAKDNANAMIEENQKFENALSLIPTHRLSLYKRLNKMNEQGDADSYSDPDYDYDDIDNNEQSNSKNSMMTGRTEQESLVDSRTTYVDSEGKQEKISNNKKKQFNKSMPKVVNTNAAVSSEELSLINTLSEKIHNGLKGKVTRSEENDQLPSFAEQYGKSIGTIGHGAYGIVKVCGRPINPNFDKSPFQTFCNGQKLFFAVKELKPKQNDPIEKFSTRITSEFIIGHSLSRCHKKGDRVSPNILKVIDLLENNDTFFEVMEFCPAGDLYSILTRKSKSGTALHPLEADCFMKQLLHGVKYMHDHGVAHCDLKPENILFHPDGLLKICDFGTSCVFQTAWEKHVHFQSGAMGSEPYVAPEEFIRDKEYDPRLVDVWSCGVVYCTMVLGHYLWKIAIKEKDGLYESYIQEMTKEKEFYIFEELRHVNSDLTRLRKLILYKLFQWNPERRITIDQLLASSWMKKTRCCVVYKK
ncbi:protein kinase HAL5 NDAI_0B00220 [Naumovozyma dairenensis CBS 421]|uniref:non-specific serine/threonine protein kinase n=1 Tax=Naumovozyma dairenensis (strain ATCC 10597 / BCRC 20456 / CBS 421 / NBRC 0211 / NRRL Y-12639) TaxID=1071378 RepID=G0W5J5_NAUDC|nr:hypothetical protein NDAI_0B00220 [Naumovozyma dairenensis CBS 421]CCD23056.1 hypothetical protein NDAI_0B00220 [Naumovozyma dairenensis CBS 421]